MTTSIKQLKLFYCYAREDKSLRDKLDNHLSLLKRQQQITTWYDREIAPGVEWKEEIDIHLNSAHIILLLVSASFLASDYCYGTEMKRALKRHAEGTARVIPIILRRVYWEDAPFGHLQVLPTDAKPVMQWPDRDEAFWNITQGVRISIKELQQLLKTKNEWLDEGKTLYELNRYEEALSAFEQALHLDPDYIEAWCGKGDAFVMLRQRKEAISAYEQALYLNSNDFFIWYIKGLILACFFQFEEAIASYEQALCLDPNYFKAWYGKGDALTALEHYEEALSAFDQALHLNPNYIEAWYGEGVAYEELKRYEEALSAFEQALRLDPNHFCAQASKASLLRAIESTKQQSKCDEN